MTSRVTVIPVEGASGRCDSRWGENNCPNPAEFLIVPAAAVAFAVMCGPHKEGFCASYRGLYRVEPYSPERAEALLAQVLEARQ